ncbi:hypothetical protein NQ317_012024 [Molorchus minor]|uniref:Protein kinase domain-containing protein n=1 Tax=Molorchus minor TaxID=1323400 RepID=A0ABQ9JZK5_9CUCU|nr:hypothetical protein NQ317_012024 [Molorchus minor]
MSNFHKVEVNKTVWEVPERYQALSAVGSGAYGQVCSALDTVTNKKVAIKKLARPFQSAVHAKRTYRELKLLKHMRHENVIGLLDVFYPKHDNSQDLKPSNIAVNEDCELKILDFGLARPTETEMTGYVATRWYRAPEIMLNWMHYNQTVDIWSVGCIMAELLTGKTLFPGTDHLHQFILGANPLAIDLLGLMLELDSEKRITAEQALAHAYLAAYADPNDEPISAPYDQSIEDMNLPVEKWRGKQISDFDNYMK